MRQLILQDRPVAYREIETTLGISGTDQHIFNIAFALHLIVQKNLFAMDPTQFVNRSKKSIHQSGKSASTIGSNACKSV